MSMMSSVRELEKLPNDLLMLVDSFKKYVREQKAFREENSHQRFSIKPILEVEKEIEENLMPALQKVDIDSHRNAQLLQQLRNETVKLVRNAEMAYSVLKFHTSTSQYFSELAAQFDAKMACYNEQIKELQMCLENVKRPRDTDELFQMLRKQHETLKALGAEVYIIQEKIINMSTSKCAL